MTTPPKQDFFVIPDIADAKFLARRAARTKRAEIHSAEASNRLCDVGATAIGKLSVIAGYWPVRTEPDIMSLLDILAARGHQIVLPRVATLNKPLEFHAWKQGDTLLPGTLGIPEPHPDTTRMTPDLLFVPMLGFDKRGYRLGYGGGYYDRTLAALRAAGSIVSIGVAYAALEIDAVPREVWDQPMDGILTETGFLTCQKD